MSAAKWVSRHHELQVKKTLITWAGDFPMTAMPAKALRLGLAHFGYSGYAV